MWRVNDMEYFEIISKIWKFTIGSGFAEINYECIKQKKSLGYAGALGTRTGEGLLVE
jgi:hypothetical protein